MTTIAEAIAERDQILAAMDVDAAKMFIVKHGGTVPRGTLDWIKVLHLTRYETRSLPAEMVSDSHIWLARHGAQSISTLPPTSPYVRVVMDLLFPRNLTDAVLEQSGAVPPGRAGR